MKSTRYFWWHFKSKKDVIAHPNLLIPRLCIKISFCQTSIFLSAPLPPCQSDKEAQRAPFLQAVVLTLSHRADIEFANWITMCDVRDRFTYSKIVCKVLLIDVYISTDHNKIIRIKWDVSMFWRYKTIDLKRNKQTFQWASKVCTNWIFQFQWKETYYESLISYFCSWFWIKDAVEPRWLFS